MKTKAIVCFIIIFVCNTLVGVAQTRVATAFLDTFLLGATNDVTANRGLIFDDGGAAGDVSNNHQVTTFHASTGMIEIYFTSFDIPYGAKLKITKGVGSTSEVMGVFEKNQKIWNVKSKDITIEYIPSHSSTIQLATGWKAVITAASMAKSTAAMLPESDCPGAIPICSNVTINTSANQYEDTGAINDDSGGCYSGTGSGGSVWYSFTPQSTGPLDFAIAPTGSTDYDFVLWDITNGCANKTQISCNFSATTGSTGLNSSGSTNSQDASGTTFNQRETVDMTHRYAICINYYSGTNAGFTLTFKNEASSVNIIDNTPPTILNAAANSCTSATSITLTTSERVQCTTIQASDFTMVGHTIGLTSTNCTGNAATSITISVSPALTTGTWVLHVQDILDMCGNNMNLNYNIVLGALPVATITPSLTTCKSPGFLGIGWNYSPGSQTLTATGGTFYQLSDGQYNTTGIFSVAPTSTTNYTVSVFNGACAATATGVVNVETVPTGTAVASPATICPNTPSTLSIAATGAASYQWLIGGVPIGGATASSTVVTPAATTTYTVRLTGPFGCTANKNVTVTTNPLPAVSAGPPGGACVGGSVSLTGTTAAPTYVWSPGATLSCTNCLTPVATPAGNTTYTLSVTDALGCTNSSTVNVTVQNNASATITAANPICAGTTDAFSSVTLNAGSTPSYQWFLNGAAIAGANAATYTTPALSLSGSVYYMILTPGGVGQCNNNPVYSNSIGVNVNACSNLTTAGSTVVNCSGVTFDDGGSAANYSETTSLFGTGTKTTSIIINPGIPFSIDFTGYSFATNLASPGPDLINIYNCNTAGCTTSPIAGSPFSGTIGPGIVNIANNNGMRIVLVAKASLFGSAAAGFGASWAVPAITCPAISGSASITPGATGIVYSVPSVAGATNYVWTAPPGCTVMSGNGTTSVTVDCNGTASSGNMSVTVSNICNPSCTSPLPVSIAVVLKLNLLSFESVCDNEIPHIKWSIKHQGDNNIFVVEQSRDAENFTELAIASKLKTSSIFSEIDKYEFTLPKTPSTFYRIKQINNTNQISYSEIFTSQCFDSELRPLNLFPNPAQNAIVIDFTEGLERNITIQIADPTGRIIKSFDKSTDIGNNSFQLDVSDLSAGVYLVNVLSGADSGAFKNTKFIKVN